MKYIKFLLVALFLLPSLVYATPVSWDFAGGILQPLQSAWTAVVKGNRFTATSTTQASTFPLFTSTHGTTTYLGINGETFTDLTGSGLTISGNALTLDSTVVRGLFSETITGLNYNSGTGAWTTDAGYTIPLTASTTNWNTFYDTPSTRITAGTNLSWSGNTLNASGGSGTDVNWTFTPGNSFVSPATSTNGIIVRASSTIGDGTPTGGLTVNGNSTTTGTSTVRTLIVGGNGFLNQSAIAEPAAWINASTSGRSGVIFQNYGNGTAPEFRFTIGDASNVAEYLSLGLTNSNAVTPGTLFGVNKGDLVYIFSNQGRDMAIGPIGGDLHLGTDSTAAGLIQIDNSTQNVLIGARATATPTYRLTVVGDVGAANLYATGTASSTYSSSTNSSIYGKLFDRTSSAGTNGMVLQTNGSGITWVATSTLGLGGAGGGTVTSVDMTVPTGFSISGNPVTTSGTLALTYSAGYEGFLTASGTNWNTFYNTPSTRITDGTGLTWSSNTLNCDTANGSTQGCLTAVDWASFNGKVSSTSIDTLSELETLMSGINIIQSTEIDTSSELAGILTDEIGTAQLVFNNPSTFSFGSATSSGSSTIANLTMINSTTTSATATTLYATNASTSNFYGAGLLTSCNGAGFKLTYGATTGKFSCEVDQTGGGSAATGTTLVCASGCPYSNIQTAIDAGVRNIQLKEETYAGPVQVKFTDTKIWGAGPTSTIISCDGTSISQPCVSIATTTRLTRVILRDFGVDNSNVTFAGTGLDTSDTSKVYTSNIRVTEFNIAHLHQDTTNSAFYSSFMNMDYYASSSCFKTGGTKSNMNKIDTARCIVTAANGIGYGFYDAEGWTGINLDSEPGSLIGTGIYVDATSISNTFITPWMEGNATGTEIRSGALNTSIKGGRITAGTVGVYDGGTNTFLDSTLVSSNTTNQTCPSTCLGTYINTASAYGSPHILVGTTTQNSSFTRLGLNISTSDATANMLVLNNAGAFATAPAGLQFTHSSGAFPSGTGRIYVNPGSGYTNAQMTFALADSSQVLRDRLTLDVNGRLGIGSTTPGHLLTVQGGNSFFGGNILATGTLTISPNLTYPAPLSNTSVQMVGTDGSPLRLSLDTYQSASTFGSQIQGRRARGTAASPSQVLTDDTLFSLGADGYGTTGYHAASTGNIAIRAAATTTDSSAPTYIGFYTSATGTVTAAERMRITANGFVGIGSTTPSAVLSIASSTYDYLSPLFSVATSSEPSGKLFTIFGTTTGATNPTTTTNITNGVRMLVGSLPSFLISSNISSGEFVNGTQESSYMYFKCDASIWSVVPSGETIGHNCQDAVYWEDTTTGTGSNNQITLGSMTIGGLGLTDAAANSGVGLFFNGGTQDTIASSSPRLDGLVVVPTTGSSTVYAGLTNNPVNGATFEVMPTAFVGFIATSTFANWTATIRTSATASTSVDTGVPSTTPLFFTVQTDSQNAYLWYGTTALSKRLAMTASIKSINNTGMSAGIYFGRVLGGGSSSQVNVGYMEYWKRKPYMRFNY